MKPAPFQYYAPTQLGDVLHLLKKYGAEARILAGGQSLVPDMNFRKISPSALIDINAIRKLQCIESDDDWLILGAGVRQSELAGCAALTDICPIMPKVVEFIGYEQTRNRGTLGGSLAYADPAGELPAMALALEAEFELSASDRSRWVSAESFYVGPFKTIVEPDEMLTRMRIPKPEQQLKWGFAEQPVKTFGKAIIGVATSLSLNDEYRIDRARVVAWGAADKPVRLLSIEECLNSQVLNERCIEAACELIHNTIHPPSDLHASSTLRSHLAQVLLRRSLMDLLSKPSEK